ncbi:MAG: carboxynorspermidine decarboxylase [Reichenbachiella sp.]
MGQIQTPFFLLEEHSLEKNLQLIKEISQSADVEIILAFKGFAMWSTFPMVRNYIKGATASSLNEVLLCKEHMHTKAHSYFVAYKPEEIEEILDNSSHITFNSLSQLERFGPLAQTKNVSTGLRINPEYSDVNVDLYNPSSPHSRLGVTSHELENGLPPEVDGLHFHVLCESDSYALEKTLQYVEKNFSECLEQIKWINLGGGHLMTRKDYDTDHLISLLKKLKRKYNLNIILEPGSAIAWQVGNLHTTVLDIVERNGIKTAIIDASFTCHMPDCLEMPYRPNIVEGDADESKWNNKYRIGGVSCLAGDYLDVYSFENKISIGDSITFKDMIHYTMVKSNTFNGVQHPAIGIKRKNNQIEVVREFNYNDYKNRLS